MYAKKQVPLTIKLSLTQGIEARFMMQNKTQNYHLVSIYIIYSNEFES